MNLNKHFGVVVSVRYNSSRLYGKALLDLDGKPAIQYLIDRLLTKFSLENIVIATSIQLHDDPIYEFCKKNNLKCYRGSLNNVAERFLRAALALKKKYIFRVTGDSIFLDMNILLKIASKANQDFTIITNRLKKDYPIGQSIDLINILDYKSNFILINDSNDLEHVTSFFFRNKKKFKIINIGNKKGVYRLKSLALDTVDDLNNAKVFLSSDFNYSVNTSFEKIYNFYLKI